MKLRQMTVLILLMAVLLCACVKIPGETQSGAIPTGETGITTEPENTTEVTTLPQTTEQTEQTETTASLHSPLYLPEYTREQVMEYFNEVVLNMEYSAGPGDVSLVQKWSMPLCYRIEGDPTQTDMEVLNSLFDWLNQIPDFPGIRPAGEEETENLRICFLDRADFDVMFADALCGEYADGATQFWYYTDTNVIHTATIGYCMDMDQETRVSILQEEIVNTLGISDTVLRTDSIVYQYSNENTTLSDMDMLIVRLLYHQAIRCGMDAQECAEVIELLYY